jgi:hypothetical protein
MTVTETVYEFSPEVVGSADFRFNPKKRKVANLAYESSRTGPHTILPSSIAYCPLNKILSPEHVVQLGRKAEQIAKESEKPREIMLARQFDQEKLLGRIEYIFDLSNWSEFFQGDPDKKYATVLQALLYPFSHGWIHVPPMDRITSAEPMRQIMRGRAFPPVGSGDGKDEFEDHVRNHTLTDWHRKWSEACLYPANVSQLLGLAPWGATGARMGE